MSVPSRLFRSGAAPLLLASSLLLCAIHVAAAQSLSSDEPDADTLVRPLDLAPGEQATAGTFLLDGRDFVICRGARWQGEPPDSRWFRVVQSGGLETNPGSFNNRLVEQLGAVDLASKDLLQQAAASLENGLRQDAHFFPFAFNAGRLYLILNQPQKAISRLRRARALLPRLAAAHYYLAQAYELAGEEQAAIASYREAARRDPGDLRPLIALGDFYLEKDQPTQAERYYVLVQRLMPDSVDARLGLARLAMRRRDWPSARVILESIETVELDGQEKTGYNRELHLYLAQIAIEERDYAVAVEQYGRLLAHPEDPFFLRHGRREIERRRQIAESLARTSRGE
ncbi:MAG: tetratricopeptide repeat protein [Leptospirales bacterium]|nr:tetratricopeptide repeat protein [Leptospirales bacterium]